MLPPLPKKNQKKEADFGEVFRAWVMKGGRLTGSYELKDSRGKDYIPFSEITQDQEMHGLRTRSDKGNLVRVENGFPVGAPDFIYLRNCPAYVVIRFPGHFECIDIQMIIQERSMCGRKSLTSKRAAEISVASVKC